MMRRSESFLPTFREKSKQTETASHDLSLRAGLVTPVGAGFYTFLPLGHRVLSNIERIVREEMNLADALEISMPILQPAELWRESGRWDIYGKEMMKLRNREAQEFCLGPTHEELVSDLVRTHLRSYKQLPFTLYQIGRKFRDELRPRHGLLRLREFVMKDAYSFDNDEEGLDRSYARMRQAYTSIFRRLGLETAIVSADSGEIGGTCSEEFLALSDRGEDKFILKEDGSAAPLAAQKGGERITSGIEIGHIFKLGDRYSRPMGITFTDNHSQPRYALMGCYGIGVSRLVTAIIEQHHDNNGIIWPASIAPFDAAILSLNQTADVQQASERIYGTLQTERLEILLDDRDVSAGTKFADANLMGIPYHVLVGSRSLKEGLVEIETRRTGLKISVPLADVKQYIHSLRNG